MARAFQQSPMQDFDRAEGGEWQDLRSELVALLDQVEQQVERAQPQNPGYSGLAERMRDLRHQVEEVAPDSRHRDALRSVQKAIDRFSDRDEPASGREQIDSAIQQIRARHFDSRAAEIPVQPAPQPRPAEVPRFDQMAHAVGGMAGRLERLESELKAQGRSQTTNVKEIADQVGQLSHVVELLAGAVGETGQVKRLEAQIAGLAKAVAQGPQVDLSALDRRLDDVAQTVAKLAELQRAYADRTDPGALNTRLDDVSATVGRLAELQAAYADRVPQGVSQKLDDMSAAVGRLADLQADFAGRTDTNALAQRFDDVTATMGRLADLQVQFVNRVDHPKDGLKEAVTAIEAGIRSIYDRIDTIEQSVSGQPADLERITEELARFTAAMQTPQQPQGLRELIDVLNSRISDIETRSDGVDGLKHDIAALHSTVTEALEPRFAAIESQITALSGQLAERPADPSIGQLEAQVRLLVARMDQTGEQLTGLARLYVQPAEREAAPDFEHLADMVAQRTSDALARVEQPGAALDDAGFEEIERRFAKVMQSASREPVADDMSDLQATIREVNERLARLETALTPAPAAKESEPPAVEFDFTDAGLPESDPLLPLISAFEASDTEFGRPARDSMPANPAVEAPLLDRPFGDPEPQPSWRKHPGLDAAPDEAMEAPASRFTAASAPRFDPLTVERPPAPKSSFADIDETFAALAATPEPVVDAAAAEPVAAPSRNTFIEAHRRAARQAGKDAAPRSVGPAPATGAAAGASLISRALARFQEANAGVITEPAPAPEPKPARAKKRKLAGDKDVVTPWSADEPKLEAAPEVAAPDAEASENPEEAPKESFLSRHRKPILLAASIVALACLTINLINQRQAGEEPVAGNAQAVTTGDATLEPVPMAQQAAALATEKPSARVIPIIDSMTTASTNSGPAQSFVPNLTVPAMPNAFVAEKPAEAAPATALEATQVAGLAPLPASTAALESPVQVDMPPAGVGPDQLRTAAANGDARAQFEVAAIYTEGRAVPEDLETAAIWYERAAAQGFAPAQYRLGNLYENGRGVAKDLAQARLWYQRAAEAGNRMGMHNLAALYAGGSLGKQEFDAAARWFEEAANRGMKDSQFNLGMLYARGLGVEQDLGASYKWFSLAASKGDADAAKGRDDIASSLDAATVQKLNDEIRAWRPAAIDLAANYAPIGTWNPSFDPGATISKPDVVRGVQQALALLGFDVGTPDGLAGRKTSEAIKAFERSTGMSESGAINPRLLAVLGSQPA